MVDCRLAYNAIIGQLTLNNMKAVISTNHLKMKFPIVNGVGEVRED
jgi:hypothetical protein